MPDNYYAGVIAFMFAVIIGGILLGSFVTGCEARRMDRQNECMRFGMSFEDCRKVTE